MSECHKSRHGCRTWLGQDLASQHDREQLQLGENITNITVLVTIRYAGGHIITL